MATEIVVPALGESVTEATVAQWMKSVGDPIAVDDPLVELETDKVTLEVYASAAGTLGEIRVEQGETVEVGAVLGLINEGGAAAQAKPSPSKAEAPAQEKAPEKAPEKAAAPEPAPKPAAAESLAPAVRKLVEENGLEPSAIPASGKDGRLTKGDVLSFLERRRPDEARSAEPKPAATPTEARPAPSPPPSPPPSPTGGAREERVRMTRLRKRIAERLKQAQNTAAMLTTFNEVDMSNIMAVRSQFKDSFEKKHGVKLGFMSFFVKACIVALKEIPAVNAEIDGDDIVYKNHYDIGVAVGTEQGLVVPVVRDADRMSFAEIEAEITELGRKARDGKLTIDELTGGTFTISNGGVYGSLMSTPILNPPQSGILGMHKSQMRPVAVDGKVEIRPMMYLALSYDHRVIDGREAVTFLVRVKECLEDPQRILLEM
ncbi:2-oxoglutarate dehydrogenase complex dihydrolipoyllysine-residue succinyltransferase [Rhodospirillaceae bacterium SYSU D60014]|uniref:2-oxoglutarate dehydrogenase complex dihydrolipoyllysine-residue succinyltransferase n=1 Tax=Virgifigura deserti TaxID=2268457 RepID=UPI000E6676B0